MNKIQQQKNDTMFKSKSRDQNRVRWAGVCCWSRRIPTATLIKHLAEENRRISWSYFLYFLSTSQTMFGCVHTAIVIDISRRFTSQRILCEDLRKCCVARPTYQQSQPTSADFPSFQTGFPSLPKRPSFTQRISNQP